MTVRTRVVVGAFGFGLFLSITTASAQSPPWKCQAQPVEACAKRHGRLSSQNGIALKIWLVGTTRMVGLENGVEDLPPLLQKYLEMTSANHSYIFGDFDICPVEPDPPGHLSRVCVAGAQNLVVQPLRRSAPPFRLLSTWPANGGRPEGTSPQLP
jgi:hypothetical protein